jgi:hypothetical protein
MKWRKQLYKVADLVFEIPCGALPSWDVSQCEPLVVGIVFPFLSHRPWQLRNTPNCFAVARKLGMMWKESSTRYTGSSVQFFPVHEGLGHPVKKGGVGVATDLTLWTIFGYTSHKTKTVSFGGRKEMPKGFELAGVGTI